MPPPPDPRAVFLNIPYDDEFRSLYIAYIAGLFQLDLIPHLPSEIAGGERRLNRISALIRSCRCSLHDLSRIEVSVSSSATPRINMPLELGMTITWAEMRPKHHTWFVLESEPYRLQRSTSDLNGTDPHIHGGTPLGVLRELRNAFLWDNAPAVQEMLDMHQFVENNLGAVLQRNGTKNPYDRSVFKELCWLTSNLTALLRQQRLAPRP